MPSLLRRSAAEGLGTFAVVFVGISSLASNYYPDTGTDLLNSALAHGLMLAVMVSATMAISGGYLNPAVTVGLLVARRLTLQTALAYVASQLLAGVLAALLLKALIPTSIAKAILLGTPRIGANISFGDALAYELVLTFFLVSAVFGTCVTPNGARGGALGIGLVLAAGMMAGGPISGGVMNPARAFGPALVSRIWTGQAIWWVGPIAGAILAAFVWELVLRVKPRPSSAPPGEG
jgi:MIP family channel proteins